MARLLNEAKRRVTAHGKEASRCNEGGTKLMNELTIVLSRVVAENKALRANGKATVERAAAAEEQLRQLKEQVQQSGGERHSTMVLDPGDSQVVLLPAWQYCPDCGVGPKGPAVPEKQGGQPEYQCCRCGKVLPGPAVYDVRQDAEPAAKRVKHGD